MQPIAVRIARLKQDQGLSGVHRSLDVYYGDVGRDQGMDALYSQFVGGESLAFDIGSHVGDRIGAFRRLGARVVALEPQPDCMTVLQALYGDDPAVTLLASACGATPGRLRLMVNSANPTVTTASSDFVRAAAGAGGWEGQKWDHDIEVPVTTLDELVKQHGTPDFVKIDVEGFEAVVLAGASQALPALSVEFTTIQRDVAYACLQRLDCVGRYRFNVALGESQRLELPEWVSSAEMARFVEALPHAANSGDIYARRAS